MANAEFPASFVYERAIERAIELEQKRLDSRSKHVDCLMEEALTRGRLWWKEKYHRSREEAEAHYDRSAAHHHGTYWWAERGIWNAVAKVAPLQRIAAAVIQSGSDQTITLTPDDCAALDIPLGFKVIA